MRTKSHRNSRAWLHAPTKNSREAMHSRGIRSCTNHSRLHFESIRIWKKLKAFRHQRSLLSYMSLMSRYVFLLLPVVIYYERKIIPTVFKLFSPEFANSEWTCSHFLTNPNCTSGHVECSFDNHAENLWLKGWIKFGFFRKNSENVPLDTWKWVLRIPIFI